MCSSTKPDSGAHSVGMPRRIMVVSWTNERRVGQLPPLFLRVTRNWREHGSLDSESRRSGSCNAWVGSRHCHDWPRSIESDSHWSSNGISAARLASENRRFIFAEGLRFNERYMDQWRFCYWCWLEGWWHNPIWFHHSGFCRSLSKTVFSPRD